MPQMAPMSWAILFLLFSAILIVFNLMNFYLFKYHNLPLNPQFITKVLSWKW